MKKLIFATAALVVLSGCNGGGNNTNIELNQNMMDQVSIKAQDWDPKHPDVPQMRMPPENSVMRGQPVYKYKNNPDAAEKQPNPLAGNMSPEVLKLGQHNYEIYCSVCHGDKGQNDGTVTPKLAVKPRVLASPEVKAYSDGRIFYAITAGRGVMGPYQGQIPNEKARWAIVNYVRTLQKQ